MSEDWTPSKEDIREAQGRGDLSVVPGYAGLVAKLHPNSIRLSEQMTAIVGYLLDQEWTEPQIVSLAITSDGFLVSDGSFIGMGKDLRTNLEGLAAVAELTEEEKAGLFQLCALGVEDWRQVELVGAASREI